MGRRDAPAVGAVGALVVLFVLAGDPARLGRAMRAARAGRCRRRSPGLIATVAEKFARGLGAIRRPGRLLRRAAPGRFRCGCRSASASGRSRWLSASPCRSPARFCCSRCWCSASPCRRPARSADFTRRSASARRCSSARRTMPRSAPRSCCTCSRSARRCCSACSSRRRQGLNCHRHAAARRPGRSRGTTA